MWNFYGSFTSIFVKICRNVISEYSLLHIIIIYYIIILILNIRLDLQFYIECCKAIFWKLER